MLEASEAPRGHPLGARTKPPATPRATPLAKPPATMPTPPGAPRATSDAARPSSSWRSACSWWSRRSPRSCSAAIPINAGRGRWACSASQVVPIEPFWTSQQETLVLPGAPAAHRARPARGLLASRPPARRSRARSRTRSSRPTSWAPRRARRSARPWPSSWGCGALRHLRHSRSRAAIVTVLLVLLGKQPRQGQPHDGGGAGRRDDELAVLQAAVSYTKLIADPIRPAGGHHLLAHGQPHRREARRPGHGGRAHGSRPPGPVRPPVAHQHPHHGR